MEEATFHLRAGLSGEEAFSSVQGSGKKKSQDFSEPHAEILEKHIEEKETHFLLSSEQTPEKRSPAS